MQLTASFDRGKLATAAGVLLAALGFTAMPAFGDSLQIQLGVPSQACDQTITSGATTVTCPGPAYGDTATAAGNLATGTFGASASVNPPNPLLGSSTSAFISVTYDFPNLPTQSGTLDFNLAINGTLSGSSTGCTQPGGCVGLSAQLYYPGQEGILIGGVAGPQGFLQLGSGVTDLIVGTNITDGTAQLTLEIQEIVSCGANFSTCGASADYLDPATITGASVYDANGNLVSGAVLISDSGFNPNAGGSVPAPEPATDLLLSAGLFGVITVSLRKATA